MSKPLVRLKVFLLIALIWTGIGFATAFVRPLDRRLGIELPPWVQVLAVLIMALAGATTMGCGLMLSTRGIGTLSGDEWMLPRSFIAHGPFRFVRNPMSLGGAMLMVGIALWHRSTLALFLAATLFVIFHLVIILVEEPGLERPFGESYRTYKRNVPRWIPRLIPWTGEVDTQFLDMNSD